MENQTIQSGDVVYLKSEYNGKSSDPSMTISSISNGVALCWYFNKITQDYNHININVTALTKLK